ncbi:hypothetical protein FHS26_003570 [Rhizobium pisi]|uniref:Uncharacterized protein n=2 Tax=Rhizobium TaxID=379 RepID=A0A7W6B3U8_9HYPH|nr:hypothetical protein [Rhizobium pisi]MBB3915098.1 hypothetical protein [Rhizobium fabae]
MAESYSGGRCGTVRCRYSEISVVPETNDSNS